MKCVVCGNEFVCAFNKHNQQTCSKKCQRLKWYYKHKNEPEFKRKRKEKTKEDVLSGKAKARTKKCYHKNMELHRLRRKRYYYKNQEIEIKRSREFQKVYVKTPKGIEVQRLAARNRNLKRRYKYGGVAYLPPEKQRQIFERDNHCCVYCHKELDLTKYKEVWFEHIIPFTKDGKIEFNIVIACRSCNTSRNNKELDYWFKMPYCIKHNINKDTINPIVWRLLEKQKEQTILVTTSL